MAGDWIKMRVGLTTHPRVLRIAECLLEDADFLRWSGLTYGVPGFPTPGDAVLRAERHAALRVTRYVTVTALLKFWGYANEHAKGDSIPGVWQEDVDEITGVPGFADAMEAAGWAEFDSDGGLSMPNFEEHNVSATERKSAGAERQKRYRERLKSKESGDVTRDVTVTEREEKRREEKKSIGSADAETTAPAKRKTKLPADFAPDATGARKAAELGLSLADELEKFRDHHTANGSVMANWQAAFRTWLGKAKQFQRSTPQSRADVSRITIPSSPERDPALVKLDEDAKKTTVAAPEIRARLADLTTQFKVRH